MAVDNFYPDPERVRAAALAMTYVEPEGHVGWRTRPYRPAGVRRRIESVLRLPVDEWPDDPDDINLGNGAFFFGLSEGARAEPVGVHYDTPVSYVTMLVYLTPDAPGDAGTSLWKHRATGLTAAPAAADARRLSSPVAEINELLDRDGRTLRLWEEIDRVGNVYNRAVFYPSGVLHSATRHFGADLEGGRIYQTFRFGVDWASGPPRRR